MEKVRVIDKVPSVVYTILAAMFIAFVCMYLLSFVMWKDVKVKYRKLRKSNDR